VAFIDEAIVLRNAGITLPILILEGPLGKEDFEVAKQHNFWLMLHNPQQISWLAQYHPSYEEQLWLKIDTGMSRLGFTPEDAQTVIDNLTTSQKELLVLCSHFLFLYSDHFSLQQHIDSIVELCRVGKQVRIYPLLSLDNQLSPHLEHVRQALQQLHINTELQTVDYQFQQGANQMLVINSEKLN